MMRQPTALWGVLAVVSACSDAAPEHNETSPTDASTGPESGTVDAGMMDAAGTMDGAGTEGDGSSGEPEVDPRPWEQGYAIPASMQVPGDAEAGYTALLNEGYVTCGIPFDLFNLSSGALGSFADRPPLPGREGNNAMVPVNWTVHTKANGAEIASLNCLECHAGEANGELVVGLGYAAADYTDDVGGSFSSLPTFDNSVPGFAELNELIERYRAVGKDIQMLTVGTNPADKLAAVLASHRDPVTLEWHDEPSFDVPDIAVPVDTPPWWHLAKKNGVFWNGMARGDHRGTMMFASSLCTDTEAEAEQILSYFNDIRAYAASIEAPPYPFSIDSALAEQGEVLFNRDCGGCHGTYDDDPALETYPNLLLPLNVVGTDPTLAALSGEATFIDWYNGSWYGELSPLAPEDPFLGYVAPPLDGIWSSAPYFHNASVPNLAMVLDSTVRPEHWRRVDYDSRNFDEVNLGWPYLEVPYTWDDAPEDERKHVYDTGKLGHGNTGHTFGDHLTADERAAVLEYLKTL